MHSRNSCAIAAVLCCLALPAWAQVEVPDEYDKLIQNRNQVVAFGNEGFGDRIDLGSGGLEIVQTDVDLPGNNALPVRVTRRFKAADPYSTGHFKRWTMDLPSVHGTFSALPDGWQAQYNMVYSSNRCSLFDKPGFINVAGASWDPDDYWHGTFFSLPGSGDQELLMGGSHVPADGKAYYAVTKEGAAARCVALSPGSEAYNTGEGFEIVTPDGVVYTLNHMVARHQPALLRDGYSMARKEYFLYPTKVTDRFGNTVTYTWNASKPSQLLRIAASDGRQLDFTYVSASSDWVASVTDGTRTWTYAYSTTTGANDDPDTVTLPDGSQWVLRLARLVYMNPKPAAVDCASMDGATSRTGWTSGSNPKTGTITSPSGATATFTLAKVILGRSHVLLVCRQNEDASREHPEDPYLFSTAAVVGKTITGPGLPAAGLVWSYSYGPTNNCWEGSSGTGIACTSTSPATRQVKMTDPEGSVTRYTFGNRYNADEGLLYRTESGLSGSSALRVTEITYADPGTVGGFGGWSPRGRGDYALTSLKRPQRKVVTTQQGRAFTWEVASDCSGMPYCFDEYARPTKVVKSSGGAP